MKAGRFILKVVAVAVAAAAAVAAVIVFWDRITEGVGCVANKVRSRRQYAEGCCVDGEEDYSDWDE